MLLVAIYAMIYTISSESFPKDDFNFLNPSEILNFANLRLEENIQTSLEISDLREVDKKSIATTKGFNFLILVDFTKSTQVDSMDHKLLYDNFDLLRSEFNTSSASYQALIAMQMITFIREKYEETQSKFAVFKIMGKDEITMITPPKPDSSQQKINWLPVNDLNIAKVRQILGRTEINDQNR
ncbi:hypothetical protein IID20_03095, partial [Patescibacteria group bacterium]|nr:hypothetical protein [Patescibacteria group bacterium]